LWSGFMWVGLAIHFTLPRRACCNAMKFKMFVEKNWPWKHIFSCPLHMGHYLMFSWNTILFFGITTCFLGIVKWMINMPTKSHITYKDMQYDMVWTLIKYLYYNVNILKLYIIFTLMGHMQGMNIWQALGGSMMT
jgi:hypothetical protein